MSRRPPIVLLLVVLVGCEEPVVEVPTAAPPPVRVEAASVESLRPVAVATGEIRALRSATLRAEAAGRVLSLDCETGQRVEQGTELARLDVGRTQVALQAAAAGVAQAEARLSQAERQRATAASLVGTGGMPQQSLDDADDGVRLARAARAAAQAQRRLTRRGLTEAVLNAPFSGTVVQKLVEVGEYVAPGTPIAIMADVEHLEARLHLDPRLALDVEVGAGVQLTAHARPGEVFVGRVLRVSEVVDPRSRRLPVEVEVLDPDNRLRPGLVARFTVETGPARSAVTVDSNALFERFARQQVYVVEDGVAHRRAVELGEVNARRAEVVSGLRQGESIIVAGLDRVVDARPVNVVEAVAADEAESAGP